MLLCLIILACCYAKIFNRLRRQEMQVHSHFQQGQQKTGLEATLNKTQYKKTVSSALCVQIAFFFCYLPHLITLLLLSAQVIMGKCRPTSSLASEIGILFVYLNSSLNPFLYCWKIRAVRQEVENYKTMVLSLIGRIVALKTFYDWLMRIDGVHLGRTNLRRKSGNWNN